MTSHRKAIRKLKTRRARYQNRWRQQAHRRSQYSSFGSKQIERHSADDVNAEHTPRNKLAKKATLQEMMR